MAAIWEAITIAWSHRCNVRQLYICTRCFHSSIIIKALQVASTEALCVAAFQKLVLIYKDSNNKHLAMYNITIKGNSSLV